MYKIVSSYIARIEAASSDDMGLLEFRIEVLFDNIGQYLFNIQRLDSYKLEPSFPVGGRHRADEEIYVQEYAIDCGDLRFNSEQEVVDFVKSKLNFIFNVNG